MVGFITG